MDENVAHPPGPQPPPHAVPVRRKSRVWVLLVLLLLVALAVYFLWPKFHEKPAAAKGKGGKGGQDQAHHSSIQFRAASRRAAH